MLCQVRLVILPLRSLPPPTSVQFVPPLRSFFFLQTPCNHAPFAASLCNRKQGQRMAAKNATGGGKSGKSSGSGGSAGRGRGRGGGMAMDSDGWNRVKRCVRKSVVLPSLLGK